MIQQLLLFVIYLIIIGLVFWLIQYVLGMLPLPEPFPMIIRVVLAVVLVIIVILMLLNLVGGVPNLRVGLPLHLLPVLPPLG